MNRKYLKSLLELALLTYAVAFLGLITADGFDMLNLGAVKAAATASLPAALAVVYGALVRLLGNYNSALAVDTRDKDH
jgi:hypothetical protein